MSHDGLVLGDMNGKILLKSNPGYLSNWFHNYPQVLYHINHFVQCKSCSMIYVNKVLNNEWLYKYYNEGIDAEKSISKIFKKEKRNQLVYLWKNLNALADKDATLKVLDYGAGWGDFLLVAKCIGVEVFGLELDQRKIDFAKRNGIPCGEFAFIEKNAPYDIFMCNQVLEHLDKPKEALKNLRSLLIEGAIGYISVPNFPIEIVKDQIRLIKQGKLPSKDFDPLGHLNYFDVHSFRKILAETGFEEIKRPKTKSIRGRLSNFLKTLKGKDIQEGPHLYVKSI